MEKESRSMPRRDFFKSSLVGGSGLLFVKPQTAFSASANSTLKMGIIGCGGRGSHVAAAFVGHTNTHVTALADLFDERLDKAQKRFDEQQADKGKPKITRFKGPRAYLELLNSDIDIVLISSPPFLHPVHLKAALEARKHIYVEKPVATDVRGCLEVAKMAKMAEGKVSVDVGFQMRRAPFYVEQTRRLHEGAIGDIALAQGFYFAGDLPIRPPDGMPDLDSKVRYWWFHRALSGDILLEQNVHIIDVFNWVLKAHPLRATATGARKVRTDIGDVWDHFIVTYTYPNDVRASFMSTQFMPSWSDVATRFFGKKGYSEAAFEGGLRIVGDNPWEAGAEEAPPGTKPEVEPLREATPEKAKALVESIQSGNYHNEIKKGVESCLSAILGREAAYEGTDMTWDELIASDQHWDMKLDLNGLSSS